MQWAVILVIALGGAIGSVARHFVSNALQPTGVAFSWGILSVNIIGSFAMGIIIGFSAVKWNLTPEMRSFLTIGILGGFTTFSSFSLDSARLIQTGAYSLAVTYIVASVALSISALFVGLWVVRVL